eukprot:5150419-Pyramimonas_sp.AAC.1
MAVEANQLLVEALVAGAEATCMQKECYTESHVQYAAELKKLLGHRRQLRDRFAWAYSEQDELQQLEIT